MAISEEAGTKTHLDELIRRLEPSAVRRDTVRELNEMFKAGRTPDPLPSGFLRGRLITTRVRPGLDALVTRVSKMWMPWLGKSFDPERSEGVNVLTPQSRRPLNVVWRSYEPVRTTADAIEAFPFRTRVAPGELDPEVNVLKIDYDLEANPDFVIRKILDELVQVDRDLFLGKILYRWKGRFHPIGFFSLENA